MGDRQHAKSEVVGSLGNRVQLGRGIAARFRCESVTPWDRQSFRWSTKSRTEHRHRGRLLKARLGAVPCPRHSARHRLSRAAILLIEPQSAHALPATVDLFGCQTMIDRDFDRAERHRSQRDDDIGDGVVAGVADSSWNRGSRGKTLRDSPRKSATAAESCCQEIDSTA